MWPTGGRFSTPVLDICKNIFTPYNLSKFFMLLSYVKENSLNSEHAQQYKFVSSWLCFCDVLQHTSRKCRLRWICVNLYHGFAVGWLRRCNRFDVEISVAIQSIHGSRKRGRWHLLWNQASNAMITAQLMFLRISVDAKIEIKFLELWRACDFKWQTT